jgi:hypothetical protein
MRARPFLVAMVFALGSVPLFPGLEWAQQSTSQYVMMTWSFKSPPPDIVYLQLYGQDSKNIWPAPDKYYKLAGRAAHKVRIRCSLGEKICYGAWTDGNTSWGVGKDNKSGGCKDCCVTCSKGDKGTETLKP